MPKLKQKTAIKRSQSKILEWLQEQGEDTSGITVPLMTDEEQLLEAQAVSNYFEARKNNVTKGWHYQDCKVCGETFVYSYHYEGIKTCSIECMAGQLREQGIEWTYGRDLYLRWGNTYPAVVPPPALEAINSLLGTDSISSEDDDDPSL